MEFRFNEHPIQLGYSFDPPSDQELANCSLFDYKPLSFVLENCSSYVHKVLQRAPISSTRKNVYVDVRLHHLQIGDSPHSQLGWHCDTTVSPDKNSNDLHHIFVTGKYCLTEFISEQVTLNYDQSKLPMVALRSMQVQLERDYPSLSFEKVPSCRWVTYGPFNFHRVAKSTGSEPRLLIRIRETDLSRRPLKNKYKRNERSTGPNSNTGNKERKDDVIFRLVESHIQAGDVVLDSYFDMLRRAYQESPPPYGEEWYGSLFRELALDLNWLAADLLANVTKESAGARKAYVLAASLPAPFESYRSQVNLHGRDEERHAHQFKKIIGLVFPDVVVETDILNAISEDLKALKQANWLPQDRLSDRDVYRRFSQINLGEIRTLVQVLLRRPVLEAIAPKENSTKLRVILDQLLKDEVRHIQYSAEILQSVGKRFVPIESVKMFTLCNEELNEQTLREVGGDHNGFKIERLTSSEVRLVNSDTDLDIE